MVTTSWMRVGLGVATGIALTVLAPREAFAQG
jgi:hypothetical protein